VSDRDAGCILMETSETLLASSSFLRAMPDASRGQARPRIQRRRIHTQLSGKRSH
jgi:hypothetical protein